MNGEHENFRAQGELSARMAGVERRLDRIEPVLGEIRDALAEQRGSRRMAIAIVSLTGIAGGMCGAFLHWMLTGRPL